MKRLILLILFPLLIGASSRTWDATDDIINTGSNLGSMASAPLTFCGWINPSSAGESGLGYAFARFNGGTNAVSFNFQNTGDRIALVVTKSVSNMSRQTDDFSFNEWASVCATLSATSVQTNINIYRNGAEVSYATGGDGSGTHDSSGAEFHVGNRTATDRTFAGQINYASVHNRVLLGYEISEIRFKPEMVPSGRQVLLPIWGDSPERDLSGNGRHGTVTGATSTSAGAPGVMFGGALPL